MLMEPETDPVMDVSVRISAGHHAPRRGQPLNKLKIVSKPSEFLEKPKDIRMK